MLYLIPLAPLVGFLINAAFGRRLPKFVSGTVVATGAMFFSFAVAAMQVWRMLGSEPVGGVRAIEQTMYTWIGSGSLQIPLAFRLDPLAAVMILVITGIGSLIHLYSTAYMHEESDADFARYFSYLNLFAAFMLVLVLGASFPVMFIGWEGVGLCSYLLIGFYFTKQSAADAGKKAFIVNRIGDFGFILGMLALFWAFGTLDFQGVAAKVAELPVDPASFAGATVLTGATLLLFLGATGKSAQLPLYVWLPDAMEGPTPVSALIHAATMVTAGVYMIGRNAVLFSHAPFTLEVIAVIGVVTALFAGTIGLVQNDIKRVLAYSTVSQLGYMFLAMGVGAFAGGIFHLYTHAFFKALLFLGSGAVIHALHGEQDLRNMGGLKKHLPITYFTFLIGTIAIAGLPPLAGFFSKDEILWKTYSSGHTVLWFVAVVAALLTATYMFRLLYMTFFGERRAGGTAGAHGGHGAHAAHSTPDGHGTVDSGHGTHLHDAPGPMAVALIVLAIGSVLAGFVGVPHALGGANRIEAFLEPSFQAPGHAEAAAAAPAEAAAEHSAGTSTELGLMLLSTFIAVAGIGLATRFFLQRPDLAAGVAARFSGVHRTLLNKYYVDEFYNAVIVQPIKRLSTVFLWRGMDAGVIDGTVNAVGLVVRGWSAVLRRLQTGSVRAYAMSFFVGVVTILGYYLVAMNMPILTLLVALPFLGGAAVLLTGRDRASLTRWIALGISLVTFVLSLMMWAQFDATQAGYQLEEVHSWMPDFGISYHVGIDGISLLLVVLTTFLTPIALLCSWESVDQRVREFSFFMLALEAAMIGVFISLDLFLFYVFWDAMLIPMYFLIGIWGYDRRIYASIKFILYTMAGSVLMLIAILWLAYQHQVVHGVPSFDLEALRTLAIPGGVQTWLFLAFAVAFAIKVPLFPFHTWLPDAHVEAPTAGSVILAGVLLKMGTYGLLRFAFPLFPQAAMAFAPYIAILAVIGIVYGALVAMVQPDMKKLVAYSSVSHLGIVVLGLCAMNVNGVQGAVYQMLAHGISTGGLFLVVGMLSDRRHTRQISEFGGLKAVAPKLVAAFLLVTLASVALPGTNGFVGEFLILIGAFNGQFDVANARYFTAVAATGVILSAVYMLWMFQRVNYGPVTNPKNRGLRDLSVREWLVIGPVCAMAIFMGVFPGVFLKPMEPAVKRTVESVVGSGRPANTKMDPVPSKNAVVVAEVR